MTVLIAGLVALSHFHPKVQSAAVSMNISKRSSSDNNSGAQYKDGSFSGQTVDVGYGPVQAQAIIKGGKIASINFLQMPDDREHSVEVTNMAKPVLLSETLTAQSADIDIASGATQTSEGYIQSLQDALSQAKK